MILIDLVKSRHPQALAIKLLNEKGPLSKFILSFLEFHQPFSMRNALIAPTTRFCVLVQKYLTVNGNGIWLALGAYYNVSLRFHY